MRGAGASDLVPLEHSVTGLAEPAGAPSGTTLAMLSLTWRLAGDIPGTGGSPAASDCPVSTLAVRTSGCLGPVCAHPGRTEPGGRGGGGGGKGGPANIGCIKGHCPACKDGAAWFEGGPRLYGKAKGCAPTGGICKGPCMGGCGPE